MANKKSVIVIDDGTRELILKNQFGTVICKLHIRTGDLSFMDRYTELMNDLGDVVKPLSGVSLNADGTAGFDAEWAVIKQVEADLMKRLSTLFDTDEVSTIFKHRHMFSSIGGEFFVEKVLAALGAEINEAIKQETELSKQRMSKYLDDVQPEAAENDRITS